MLSCLIQVKVRNSHQVAKSMCVVEAQVNVAELWGEPGNRQEVQQFERASRHWPWWPPKYVL